MNNERGSRRSLDERQSLCQDLRKSVLFNQGGKNLTVITIIVKYLWRYTHDDLSSMNNVVLQSIIFIITGIIAAH